MRKQPSVFSEGRVYFAPPLFSWGMGRAPLVYVLNKSNWACPEVWRARGTYFLSAGVFAGGSSAGGSELAGGSDRDSFSREARLSSLWTHNNTIRTQQLWHTNEPHHAWPSRGSEHLKRFTHSFSALFFTHTWWKFKSHLREGGVVLAKQMSTQVGPKFLHCFGALYRASMLMTGRLLNVEHNALHLNDWSLVIFISLEHSGFINNLYQMIIFIRFLRLEISDIMLAV